MNDLATPVDRPAVWHDDTLPGMVWMAGAASEYHADPVDEYTIGATTGPVGYVLHRGTFHGEVHPGSLVVLDPEHPHHGHSTASGPWTSRLVALPAALLWSTLDDPPAIVRSTFAATVVDAPDVYRRFVELHRASQRGASRLERECRLLTLLDDIVTAARAQARPSGDPAVATAVTFIRDCFLGTVDLDTLAAVAGTSRFRLLRAFRREVGMTPHQFLVSVRVGHARRLIANGEPPSAAAALSRFADQSHLHRHFHPRLGMTPGRYRQATTRGDIGRGGYGAPT